MLKVEYPEADTQLNLGGIFSIEASDIFDTIYLGNPSKGYCLGYIGSIDGQYLFKSESSMDQFPLRFSYEEALLDVFIYLANDPDYAQEFAILTLRKALDNS